MTNSLACSRKAWKMCGMDALKMLMLCLAESERTFSMPDSYKVYVSARAEQLIADKLASPQAAKRLLGYLQSEINSLAVFPERGNPKANGDPVR